MSGPAGAPDSTGAAPSATPNGAPRAGQRDFLRLALLVARRDYLRTVRRRGYVFGTLLLPAGIALLMFVSGAISFSGGVGPTTVNLVIVNDSPIELATGTPGGPTIRLVDRAEAAALIEAGSIGAYFVIPPGFPVDRLVTRVGLAEGQRQITGLQASASDSQALATLLRTSLLLDAGLPADVAEAATSGIEVVSVTPDGDEVSEMAIAAGFIVPVIFTLLFVMSIFITSGYLLQSVTEEKENRVVEIVLSSVPALPLMAGKIGGLGAAGLTQVVIWIATALLLVPLMSDRLGPLAALPVSPVTLLLAVVYFVLGYLCFGAIFAAIGALAPGNREAQQYSGFFGFFAVIPLVLSGLFVTDPGSPLVTLLALVPLTAPATMLQLIATSDELPVGLVIGSLASLTTFVVLSTVACARIFRATVLLYGARPGMRQLIAVVRTG